MRPVPGWKRTALLVLSAFAGGAVTSHLAHATTEAQSPYALFDQLARVLVLVENQYVDPAHRSKVVEGAIKGMVAELDPHSAFMNAEEFAAFQGETEGKFGGVGIEVDFKDDVVTVIAPIEGSPAERAGVRSGDVILAVDGRPIKGERLDKLIGLMRGAPGTKVKLTLRRQKVSEPVHVELTREEIRVTSVVAKRLDGDVAYVRLKQFQESTHDELLRAAGGVRSAAKAPLRGVILDMRNNPGGLVDQAESVSDEFLPGGTIYSTRHRGKVISESKASGGGAFAQLPVVVLVNEYSASSSELVAGALQDNARATIVGANTFGKGSVQTIYPLPGGAGMRLTTMRYYTPSGRSIQAEGIRPDVMIERAGKDGKPVSNDVLRERDLEGHLPSETAAASSRGQRVLVDPGPPPGVTEEPHPAREVLADPRTGTDFALKVAYGMLVGATK